MFIEGGVCVSNCATGTYGEYSTRTCEVCPLIGCTACDHIDVCTTCEKGYQLNPATATCDECRTNCADCDLGKCFECKAGTLTYLNDVGMCVENCGVGKFKDEVNLVCGSCPID
jgi:hypothetical protein